MPKINVYLPDDLAEAVREADVPVSAVCQAALEEAVRNLRRLDRGVDSPRAFGRFTAEARGAVADAHLIARGRRHQAVGPEHLLMVLLQLEDDVVATSLESMGVAPVLARAALSASFPPDGEGEAVERIPFGAEFNAALRAAARESLATRSERVGAEHLVLGLLRDPSTLASTVLASLGVTLNAFRRNVPRGASQTVDATDVGARMATLDLGDQLRQLQDHVKDRFRILGSQMTELRAALVAHGIEVRADREGEAES